MSSLRIARIAGIDIKLHATFALIVLWGAWQWGAFGVTGALFGALLTLCIFASVTLHELGHSLVARAYGIPVKDITLTPIGGIAQLGARPKTPGQEFLIALAGPAVNVVLVGLLGGVSVLSYGADPLRLALLNAHLEAPTLMTLLAMVIVSNGALAIFNLLPALPMDGGRIFRALLSMLVGQEKATRWAAFVGRVFAVAFIAIGGATLNYTLLLVGVFVFVSAGAEVRAVQMDRALEGIRAKDAVNPYAPRFLPATTLGEAMQALVYTPYSAFAVEHFGRLVGVVTRDQLLRGANELGAASYVAGLMRRDVPVIDAQSNLEAARLAMNEAMTPYVGVVDRDLFLGLLTEHELAQQAAIGHTFAPMGPSPSRPQGRPAVRRGH
jgi:Zn-dependent protease/predicted transcriptional regulator